MAEYVPGMTAEERAARNAAWRARCPKQAEANDYVKKWVPLCRKVGPPDCRYTRAQKAAFELYRRCQNRDVPLESVTDEDVLVHARDWWKRNGGYVRSDIEIPESTLVAGVSPENDVWGRLTLAAFGRTASRWAVMEWVNDCLLVQTDRIDPASVPSQGAPALLKWAKENQKEFYAKYLARVEADEVKVSSSRGLMADGRDVRELVAELQDILARRRADAVVSAGSEGAGGESGVSV